MADRLIIGLVLLVVAARRVYLLVRYVNRKERELRLEK